MLRIVTHRRMVNNGRVTSKRFGFRFRPITSARLPVWGFSDLGTSLASAWWRFIGPLHKLVTNQSSPSVRSRGKSPVLVSAFSWWPNTAVYGQNEDDCVSVSRIWSCICRANYPLSGGIRWYVNALFTHIKNHCILPLKLVRGGLAGRESCQNWQARVSGRQSSSFRVVQETVSQNASLQLLFWYSSLIWWMNARWCVTCRFWFDSSAKDAEDQDWSCRS